jgi:hypothetical protein
MSNKAKPKKNRIIDDAGARENTAGDMLAELKEETRYINKLQRNDNASAVLVMLSLL